ncbi:MAG: hypothetical protein ABR517_03695 [Thermoanaerobaculia bacterium]
MTSVTVLERITRVTPLGVRLRDEATRTFVTESIVASVYRQGSPERRRWGIANRNHIFVFRDLPGMGEIERGAGDAAFWTAHPPQSAFILEVLDRSGRYLPFRLPVRLPQRRVLGIALASPLTSPPALQTGSEEGWLPLYASPTYAPLDGLGVLRATLVDAGTQQPAAWALLEVKAGEQRVVTGMADREGRVMLPLYYPKPVIILGSPGTINTPLPDQEWTVALTIRYRRRMPAPEIADLGDVLTQPAATAWKDVALTNPLTAATLHFGRELRLASEDASAQPTATLLITPAGSPP